MAKKGHEPHSLEGITRVDETGTRVIHYTCNPPSDDVLIDHGVESVGKRHGCSNNNEVLIIPTEHIERHTGRPISGSDQPGLILDCERTLVAMERGRRGK